MQQESCIALPFPGFPCASLSAAYPLFPGKHLSEESHRNQPENKLSPSSLRQYPEFTKLIHLTNWAIWKSNPLNQELNKEGGSRPASGKLKCFPSAVQITLEHLYTMHVLNAAQASSISQLQIKADKCTKPQTDRWNTYSLVASHVNFPIYSCEMQNVL